MVNYNNGKIYKIEDLNGEMCYIGSTTKDRLCQRMVDHRTKYHCWRTGKTNKCTVFDIFDTYGIDNCRIVLLETYPCNNRDELTAKEGEYILATKCINKRIEGRSHKQYLIDNDLKIKAVQALYRDEHRAELKEWKKVSIECVCGISYTQTHKSRHFQTKAHKLYIAENPIEV
jgi:hypothetical protein